MKKKILLVSPDAKGLEDKTAYMPLGLLYIASNMSAEWDPYIKICLDDTFTEFGYDYYGISVHSVGVVKETRRLIDLIKKNNPTACIYLGGSAAVMFENETNVWVIKGEAEQFFGNVDVSNLDNIRYPARYLLPDEYIRYMGNVHHTNEPSTTIIATRGCVYNCAFCDRETLGRRFRKRSVMNVIGEIELLMTGYGITWFRFIDDCLTLDKKWLLELCAALEPYQISWTCLSRADLLTEDILKKMKAAGCKEVFFGFESGSQKMLDLMNKMTTVEKNKKAIEMCRNVGIVSCVYMMFGFPGETSRTVNDTILFLKQTKPDKSRLSIYVPIPGTAVWNNPSAYGVRIKPNYEDFWYFDRETFALHYPCGDHKMNLLKKRMLDFYADYYKEGWVKKHV